MSASALPSRDVRTPTKFAHVVIRTAHYAETVRWYETVLGARVVFGNPMLSFLTYDDEHHRVAVVNVPDLPELPSGTAGVDHVAFTFARLGDLLHTDRRQHDHAAHAVPLDAFVRWPEWCELSLA